MQRLNKYILSYQKHFFIGILIAALFGFIFSYLVALLIVKPVWKQPTLQDIENCGSVLCIIQKEAIECKSMFCIAQLIFTRNLQSQSNILIHNVIKPKYVFMTPFIAAWYEGMSLGPLLYMRPKNFLLGTLFPHGLIELFAGYMSGSLFYSGLIESIRTIFGKSKLGAMMLLKVILIQAVVILALYAASALLEAIPISIKMNIL